jgi:hypothetical protein
MAATKKVTIPVKDLPPMLPSGKHLVRYRIVSEDKNRVSAWSPIYSLAIPAITKAVTEISASGTVVTYTTAIPHNFVVGDAVSIADTDPAKYSYSSVMVIAPVTSNTFSVASVDTGTHTVNTGRVNSGAEIRKSVAVSGKTATLSWTFPESIDVKSVDVYVRAMTGSPGVWGSYVYYKTVTEGSCTYIASALESKVQFLVQASTYPQIESAVAAIFYSAEHNI